MAPVRDALTQVLTHHDPFPAVVVDRMWNRVMGNAAGDLPATTPSIEPLLPVLPLELNIDELKLSLFTVISTFGTPQDITTGELRIEAFYPSDDATRAFFTQAAGA